MIRNVHLWIGSYLRDRIGGRHRRIYSAPEPIDLLFCVADHFEPLWGNPDDRVADQRMATWMERYPEMARRHRDAEGRHPVHTFFFPAEQYRPPWLDQLATLTREGFGEVEIHLHHGPDTIETVRKQLTTFRDQLGSHKLLSFDKRSTDRSLKYGFIHGDWALANSGPGPDTCGVDDELRVLKESGCYADFTLPSAPSPAQIPTINRIFFADLDANGKKPHARGTEAAVGARQHKGLLLIEGPLGLDWRRRKFGLLPRIENGDLSRGNPPHPRRVPLWLEAGVHVQGKPEWCFLKLYTHGAPEVNHDPLLGTAMDHLFSTLEQSYNDGRRFRLHYVSAREMFNIACAAMDKKKGNAGDFRNYLLTPNWKKSE